MKNERLISVGDVLYIIGKYSFSVSEKPEVIEVQVASKYRRQYNAFPTKGHGSFMLKNSYIGDTVFFNREDAERALYGERKDNDRM